MVYFRKKTVKSPVKPVASIYTATRCAIIPLSETQIIKFQCIIQLHRTITNTTIWYALQGIAIIIIIKETDLMSLNYYVNS